MLFRFWLFTYLIAAFVAYSGAFGIGPIPAAYAGAVFLSPSAGYTILDDDAERGR